MKKCAIFLLAIPAALPAFAAEAGFIGKLTDPTTGVAFAAMVGFLLVAWRAGGFKAITKGLDDRSAQIAEELDRAQSLREQAAEKLAEAERSQKDAGKEAEAIIARAEQDAKAMVETARLELEKRIKRREALAEVRIKRAETEAASEVRKAAADAATNATRKLLQEDTATTQFERAAREIETAFKS